MLEDNLNFLNLKIKILKIFLPIVSIGGVIWYLNNSEGDKDPGIGLIILLLFCIGLSGFLMLKNIAEQRVLARYIDALKSKKFDEALHHGRMYYGIKRNGIKGAAGEGLTIYDEQTINNDISAYSNI